MINLIWLFDIVKLFEKMSLLIISMDRFCYCVVYKKEQLPINSLRSINARYRQELNGLVKHVISVDTRHFY